MDENLVHVILGLGPLYQIHVHLGGSNTYLNHANLKGSYILIHPSRLGPGLQYLIIVNYIRTWALISRALISRALIFHSVCMFSQYLQLGSTSRSV